MSAQSTGNYLDLSEGFWNLWCDREASWENDTLYLPGQFDLKSLPVNPPSIGWERMYEKERIEEEVREVHLPTTVEEHFWGKYSHRPYEQDEYFYAHDDSIVKNGAYQGVSWWWREVFIPKEWENKKVRIKFSGARLRAEVYLNEKLVGYDIIAETPFDVDITDTARFGRKNRLAVRITNPGGRLDWPDFSLSELNVSSLKWGDYRLPLSHGFGGLDTGIEMEALSMVHISDIFVKNKPQIRDITIQITVHNSLRRESKGDLTLHIFPKDHPEDVRWQHVAKRITFNPGKTVFNYPASIPSAKLWDPDNPNLYTVRVKLNTNSGEVVDERQQDFGFRWFEVRGMGNEARFYLNEKRITLRSAISWGFWPLNGLFPTEEFAKKEVKAAKDLGLNMLNFHRNIGKSQVLQEQDRQGLLRYEEPGAGCFAWSEDDFAREYEKEKIRRMVLRDRNHPSLIIYCLQNEQVKESPDNPYIEDTMQLVHTLDPTRVVILKSAWSGEPPEKLGSEFHGKQAFYLPHDDTYYKDDGTGWCGWYDQHTVGGPGIWRDELYKGPGDISHCTDNRGEIVFWGEVLGVGTPDNLQAIWDFYREKEQVLGYNRADHEEWYRAYDKFLDEKNFREAFPHVGDLITSIGNKSYNFWGRMVENIRICDTNDGMAISGWESTPIENHSGIVDVFRNFKGDPELISYYNRPVHLAVKSQNLVLERGAHLVTDLYLVNEKNLQGSSTLTLVVIGPEGKTLEEKKWEVRLADGDVFGQLLKEAIETSCYDRPGYYTLRASLKWEGGRVEGKERIFVVDWASPGFCQRGAILEPAENIAYTFLKEKKGMELPDFSSEMGNLDYILVADKSPGSVELESGILNRVAENGTNLILIPNDRQIAESWAKRLAEEKIVEFKGMVGPARASWMGSWYFVRKHPLFEQLPVNTTFNWEYQIDVRGLGDFFKDTDSYGTDGMMLEGNNVEYVVGYGRDHDRNIGAGVVVIEHGKGKIILSCIPGLYEGLEKDSALPTAVARKLLCNFILFR